jgi:hypothetical protein
MIEDTICKVLDKTADRWGVRRELLMRFEQPENFKKIWPVIEIVEGLCRDERASWFLFEDRTELDGLSLVEVLQDDEQLAAAVRWLEWLVGRGAAGKPSFSPPAP